MRAYLKEYEINKIHPRFKIGIVRLFLKKGDTDEVLNLLDLIINENNEENNFLYIEFFLEFKNKLNKVINLPQTSEKLIKYLNKKGIMAVFHYLPLHLSKNI